jgi:carnitine 3-dehydrogenase
MIVGGTDSTFPRPADVRVVGVVGAGTIGASWAAWFLAAGREVHIYDEAPDFATTVMTRIRAAWPALLKLGTTQETVSEALERVRMVSSVERAVAEADFVQESAFERVDLKRDLLARIDAALREDRVVASSTSGFGVTALQAAMQRPDRLVIGHPFNPPHLIPLVEVVGGGRTSDCAVQWALEFYRHVGKRPIHIRKEVTGHLANRLQAALWREAVHLIAEDVASVADIDTAIAYGPGLRWAIMGPNITFALAGGEGGMANYLDHLGVVVERWWSDLGRPSLTPETRRKLVEGVTEEMNGRTLSEIASSRDELLIGIMKLLEDHRTQTARGSVREEA